MAFGVKGGFFGNTADEFRSKVVCSVFFLGFACFVAVAGVRSYAPPVNFIVHEEDENMKFRSCEMQHKSDSQPTLSCEERLSEGNEVNEEDALIKMKKDENGRGSESEEIGSSEPALNKKLDGYHLSESSVDESRTLSEAVVNEYKRELCAKGTRSSKRKKRKEKITNRNPKHEMLVGSRIEIEAPLKISGFPIDDPVAPLNGDLKANVSKRSKPSQKQRAKRRLQSTQNSPSNKKIFSSNENVWTKNQSSLERNNVEVVPVKERNPMTEKKLSKIYQPLISDGRLETEREEERKTNDDLLGSAEKFKSINLSECESISPSMPEEEAKWHTTQVWPSLYSGEMITTDFPNNYMFYSTSIAVPAWGYIEADYSGWESYYVGEAAISEWAANPCSPWKDGIHGMYFPQAYPMTPRLFINNSCNYWGAERFDEAVSALIYNGEHAYYLPTYETGMHCMADVTTVESPIVTVPSDTLKSPVSLEGTKRRRVTRVRRSLSSPAAINKYPE